jgi:hypothetical protein
MQDMNLKAKRGADLIEATGIHLKNVNLVTNQDGPVFNIQNSKSITIDGVNYIAGSELLFSINGEKSTAIRVTNTDVSRAKSKTQFNAGASPNSIEIK